MTEPATNRDDEYLTMQYVADHLFVSKRQVRRWIATGKLRAAKLGHRTVRISRESFAAFLAARRSRRLLTIADHGAPATLARDR